jgi:hypothetical protein
MYGIEFWGIWLEKLLFESLWKGHEDVYDVSRQSVFFNYLSYHIGQILIVFHIIIFSQAYYGLSTMAQSPISLLVSQ